jgi:hypothetical protein
MNEMEDALALLGSTKRSDVEQALGLLSRAADELRDEHRPALRRKYIELADGPPANDKAGNLRESLTRLLARIANPTDADLFIRSASTYYPQPVEDVAQNLRAAGLVGLAEVNRELACTYAAALLGEPDTSRFNGEPSLMAVAVLARFDQPLVLLHFARTMAYCYDARQGEALAKAFESLPDDLPTALLIQAARPYLLRHYAVPCTGIINVFVKRDDDALHDLLEQTMPKLHDIDLHRYAAIMLATARKPALVERLVRLAGLCPVEQAANYSEALELTEHPRRAELLALLHKRAASVSPKSRRATPPADEE